MTCFKIHPCLFTIPVATAGALFMLPLDVSGQGALMWPSWVLTIGLLGGIAIDCLDRGLDRMFRAEHALLVALVVIVYPELLQPFYTTYLDAKTVQKVFITIGIFATMIILGASVDSPNLSGAIVKLAKRRYSAELIFGLMLLCWVLAMFNFVYASDFSMTKIVDGLLAGRFSAPWSRGQLGSWDAFRDFLNYFGYIAPTFTVALALRCKSWSNPMVLLGLLCSVTDVAFIAQSGTRQWVVDVIGAAMLTWLCAKRRHLRFVHYIAVLMVVLATVVFSDIMLSQRNAGFRGFSYDQYDFSGLRVDDNFHTLGETLRLVPTEVPFVGFQHLWYVAAIPIPRVFWKGKPTGSGFDLPAHLGLRGLTLAISAIGECYISFGWMGVVVGGIVFGWLAGYWSQLLEADYGVIGTALYGLGTMALFLGIRSLLDLIWMTYPIVSWYALDRLLHIRTGKLDEKQPHLRTVIGRVGPGHHGLPPIATS